MYGALAGAAINVRGVETARPTAAAHDGQSGFDYLLLIEREGARPGRTSSSGARIAPFVVTLGASKWRNAR